MSVIDQRWSKITPENFNTGQYQHHNEFANTIRNTLKSKKLLHKLIRSRKDELKKLGIDDSDSQVDASDDRIDKSKSSSEVPKAVNFISPESCPIPDTSNPAVIKPQD